VIDLRVNQVAGIVRQYKLDCRKRGGRDERQHDDRPSDRGAARSPGWDMAKSQMAVASIGNIRRPATRLASNAPSNTGAEADRLQRRNAP